MIPPHLLIPNISFLSFISKMSALRQNMANCHNTLTLLTLRWRIFLQDVRKGQMCMTDAGTTQDNVILPAPPISHHLVKWKQYTGYYGVKH